MPKRLIKKVSAQSGLVSLHSVTVITLASNLHICLQKGNNNATGQKRWKVWAWRLSKWHDLSVSELLINEVYMPSRLDLK